MKPLLDAKNWDGALAVIDGVLATVDPNGYDNAFVSDIKAKVFLQKNDYAAAIAPMETSLRLADKHPNYFDKKSRSYNIVYFLAQIYYQEGTSSKVTSVQQQYFNKSSAYIKRWLQTSPKKNQEAALFYASILYNQAVVNPDKVDIALVRAAKLRSKRTTDRSQAQRGLLCPALGGHAAGGRRRRLSGSLGADGENEAG